MNNGKLEKTRPAWIDKDVFTTGEAAEICHLSQQSIIRCFDKGRLKGFKVPNSRFRRIPRAELIKFMRVNKIPTDVLGGDGKKFFLVVDGDKQVFDPIIEVLDRDDRFEIGTVSTGYDTGFPTVSFGQNLLIFVKKPFNIEKLIAYMAKITEV